MDGIHQDLWKTINNEMHPNKNDTMYSIMQ